MSQRQSGRTEIAVEVVVEVEGGAVSRGSLIYVSDTGMRLRYLPAAVTSVVAVGTTVTISGAGAAGPFRAVGTVRRVDHELGELGVQLPSNEAEALRAVLDSPIAGSGTPF